jgi:hypothetical protein
MRLLCSCGKKGGYEGRRQETSPAWRGGWPGQFRKESLLRGIHSVGDEARPHPNPLPQEREFTNAAPGGPNEIKPSQTVSDWIKPARGGGGCGVDSGQWLVAGGWWRKRPAESRAVKPSQTQSNRFDSGSSKNKTIISEMLMLVPGPKLHSVGLNKPDQTKSNQIKPAGRKKMRISRLRFKIQWSRHHSTPEKAKQR